MSIDLVGVYKSYHTRQGPSAILKDINFSVGAGEHVGILGQNGAGKSTLIRILGGSENPTKGNVVRGMSVSWPLAFGGAFLNALTGIDNVRFVCRLYGVSPEDKIPFVQDFTELGKYLREPVKTYSSGMRARLAFAVSMAIDFDCYLIDEIVAVGDDRFQRKCQIELFDKRADKALLLVSHSADFIRAHCQKASVLTAGELTNFDNVDDAFRFYSSHELAMQPHMAQAPTEPAVHLPENAVQRVAEEFEGPTVDDGFDAFLASINLDRVPVFDSCDVVGRLSGLGKPLAATATARWLTGRQPNEPLFWITLGDLYCQRRQHVPGVEAYQEALRLDPESYWGNRNLATEFFNVGRYEDAIPVFKTAMAVAPNAASRLELQLRWLDCRSLLDQISLATEIDFSVAANSVLVVDQSCSALSDSRSARMAIAGLAGPSTNVGQLQCIFRAGDRRFTARPTLGRNSIRRLAASSGNLAFAFVCYAPLADADIQIDVELRTEEGIVFSGTQDVRRSGETGGIDQSYLTAARSANAEHRFEASSFLYGLSDQAGEGSDIVPFVENLISIGLYDEAEFRLRRWLRDEPPDHPDRSFVMDLACVEIARSRLPGWRRELEQLLQDESQNGQSASLLANLGHVRVDDGDIAGATPLYEAASRAATGQDVIHFARGIHTAKLAGDVARHGLPFDGGDPDRSNDGLVHLFACDSKYFTKFAPALVASSIERRATAKLVIHAHIVDPDAEALAVAEALQKTFGLRYTTEITPDFVASDEVKRAYYTCARFLGAPKLLTEYRLPIIITETDCLINWQWTDLLRYIGSADTGHLQSSVWNWVPWIKIPAGIFLFAPTAAGIEQSDYIARFIRHAFDREGSGLVDLWTVDQVALWLSQSTVTMASRSVHLPMASVLTLATGDKENVL